MIDASLATKWFQDEADSFLALGFFEHRLDVFAAPDILLSEVAGAIVRENNMRLFSTISAQTKLAEWFGLWEDGTISAHRIMPSLMSRSASIALALGHPLPDCIYLALAIELDCDLATCDVKFRDSASMIYERVRLLSDYPA